MMDEQTLNREFNRYPDRMSPAERARAYEAGEEVDRIPLSLSVGETMAPEFGYTVGEYRRSVEVRCRMREQVLEQLGLQAGMGVRMGLKGIGEALGTVVKYPENDLDIVQQAVLRDYDQLPSLKLDPDHNPFLQGKLAEIRAIKARLGADFPVSTAVAGPISTALAIREAGLVMRDMIRAPEQLHQLLAFGVACSVAWVELVTREFGPVSVGIAEPGASSSLISLRQFRTFCKPHLKTLIEEIQRVTGRKPGLHICGRSQPIWEDLLDVGVTSFSVDNCEDLTQLKQAMGDRAAISGNVPPVEVMRDGSIDDVIHSVQQCLCKASDSPMGYTLDVGCQIPIGTPLRNLKAYLYAARRYGRGAKKGSLCRGLMEEGLV